MPCDCYEERIMNNGYVINVTAVDRPGIVAGVSSAIVSLDGNNLELKDLKLY